MPGTKRVSARTPVAKYGAKKKAKYTYKPTPTKAIMSLRPQIRKMFPSTYKQRATLRYFYNFVSVNPGVGGTAATVVVSANGCWDPDITGGGHQPIGFDQYMALYQNYTVIGAKISSYFENTDNANAQFCFVRVSNSASNVPDTREVVENGYVNMGLIQARTLDKYTIQLAQSVDIAKFLGINDIMDETDCSGDASGNPIRQLFFHLGAFPTTSTDSAAVVINAIIEYDVVFHERRLTLVS